MNWTMPWKRRRILSNGGVSVRGFAAAQVDRLLAPWKFDGGFTSEDISRSLAQIRSRSRDMQKNSPHLRRFLQLVETNVVGEGFNLKSTPRDGTPGAFRSDDAAARFIEYHFWRWCNTPRWCDATGRKTVAAIDRLNAKTWARDGEYFILPQAAANPYGVSLRVVRPDACDETYNATLGNGVVVKCGVEMHESDMRPRAYYFQTHPSTAYVQGKRGPLIRIPATHAAGHLSGAVQVIHGFTAEDEDQPRGIPWSHAILTKLKMMDEYDRAEITAARDEACSVRNYYAPAGSSDEIADLTDPKNSAVANALMAEKEPGQSEVLPIGYKQEINTPQHPNRELTAFKSAMTKDVATGLGVEYANFANDWAGVSFSSVRLGTISERDMWMVLQNTMIEQSKSPVFLVWLQSFLSLAISEAYPLAKFNKFSEHEFRGRRWMWVDPMKDMAAAVIARDHGWKTDTAITADMGGDFDDNVETIKRETATTKGTTLERAATETPPAERALRLIKAVADVERAENENANKETEPEVKAG